MTDKKRVSPAEPDLRETIANLGDIARGQLSDFEDEFRRVRKFVEKNPVVAVAGALAIGWVLGRLFRKERVVYVERSES